MPFYDYVCLTCGVDVLVRSSMEEAGEVHRHDPCDQPMQRVWTMPLVAIPDPGGNDFMNRVASGDIEEADLHGMDKENARKTALGMAHAQKHRPGKDTEPSHVDKFYT